jgi:hypothetical protein
MPSITPHPADMDANAIAWRLLNLGRDLLRVHSEIQMDTAEDKALHARAVAAFEARYDQEAAFLEVTP